MKHTKYIFTILFLTIAQFASAQKEPIITYEWLEEKSKIISDLQMKKTGLKIDGYDVSFAKDNFKVYYNDKLASQSAQYKKTDAQLVAIVEDVDFSKAIGLFEDNNIVYVVFPDNSLTIQVYGNDQSTTAKVTSMDFYTNSDADREKMLSTLYKIITRLKADKGLITESEASRQWEEYQSLKPYDFYEKYPKSVLAYEGKGSTEDFKKQSEFFYSLIKKYDVPPYRLKLWMFEDDESVKKLIKAKNRKYNFGLLPFKHYFTKQSYFASYIKVFNQYYYPDESEVSALQYTVLVTKNKDEALKKAEDVRKELLQNTDSRIITKNVNINDVQFGQLFEDEDASLNNKEVETNVVVEADYSKETRSGLTTVRENETNKDTYNWKKIRVSLHTMEYKKEKFYTVAISIFRTDLY